jgi:acetyl esterase
MKSSTAHTSIEFQLDPEIRVFADAILEDYSRLATSGELTVHQMRENAEIVRERWAKGGPEMARETKHRVIAKGYPLTLKIYEPTVGELQPALIYLHGGGWSLFSLDTHDRLMREYAHRAGITVVGVDYSLAPEFKFPHQIEEIYDVILWLRENGNEVGIDRDRLAIGGDSAGANLSVSTCLKTKEAGQAHWIKAMLLNYGTFDADVSTPSHEQFGGESFLLTKEEKVEFWNQYLTRDEDAANPIVSPLLADLRTLPPTCMVIASHDILYDENISMAQRLTEAGVPLKAVVYPGTTHSFLEAVSIAKVSDRALSESSIWLREILCCQQPICHRV